MASPAEIIETLEARYEQHLRAVSITLATLRDQEGKVEAERDLLLRESAPVLRRDKAAAAAGLSLPRVQQIIGARA